MRLSLSKVAANKEKSHLDKQKKTALLVPRQIRAIIPNQGLFTVTVKDLFTRLKKNVPNGPSSVVQAAEIVNMFFSCVHSKG